MSIFTDINFIFMEDSPQLTEIWRVYWQIEVTVKRQADPYYYNWIGGVIIKEINFLKRLLKESSPGKETETTELLKRFSQLEKLFFKNHPWKNIKNIDVSEISENGTSANSICIEEDNKDPDICENIGWLLAGEKLNKLHKLFFMAGKIDCDYRTFSLHFIGGGQINQKIKWVGKCGELVHCISWMIDKKMIPFHHDYITIICKHFCKSSGISFNQNTCRVLKSRLGNFFVVNFIEAITNEIS